MNRQQRLVDTGAVQTEDEAMSAISREEVDLKLTASRAEVDARLANFEAVVKTGFAELRGDLARQDAKFSGQDAKLDQVRSEMHKNTSDIIKWAVGTGLAFTVAIVSILTLVLNNALKHAPAPAAQQPTIIVVPSAASLPTPPR